jgi:hypothetical protein
VLEQQNSLKKGYKFFFWWTNETHVCSVVFPFSNTLIRDLNGSPSLHKSVSNSNSSSAHTVYSDSFLARRFSDQGFRSTNSCFPYGGSLLPSLERLEASVEEDKTVEAECGDALAESLPRVS